MFTLPAPHLRTCSCRHALPDAARTHSFSLSAAQEALVRALGKAGFTKPSPVQLAAIPLGRFGADLIIQAG
jgi:ATP-dependent RNA helicase DDX20